MSDFGLFDSIETSDNEQRIATRESTQVIDRAIHDVSERFGRMLSSATSREDFNDRVALVKNDMMKIVAEHIMPKPAVMRQVVASQKPEFGTKKASGPEDEDTPENLKAWEQDYEDDQDGTRQLHERGPLASKTASVTWTDKGDHFAAGDYSGVWGFVKERAAGDWAFSVFDDSTATNELLAANSGFATAAEAMSVAGGIIADPTTAGPQIVYIGENKTADTSVDPQHLPDHFDDEGSVTDLDDAGRDTAPKDAARHADQDAKGKALKPKKDWAGYLRDRAAGGKKVRDHNFTKGSSLKAQAAKDFPELAKTAGLDDWEFVSELEAAFQSEEVNALLKDDRAYDGSFLLEMFFYNPGDDFATGTKIVRVQGNGLEDAVRNAEPIISGEVGHDPFMYAAKKKTAAQLEWYGEGNDYQTFFEDDAPPPGPQGYVGIDLAGSWYGYIYDAYANENIWDGSGFANAHDAINAVDGKLLTLGTYVAGRTASDADENLISARVIQRKHEAREDPKEVNPEPSGSDAYHRSEDMETLDPDKTETQPKDASRRKTATDWAQKGRDGFAQGLARSPMAHPDVADAVADMGVGEGAADIMKAYSKGWDAANLADDSWMTAQRKQAGSAAEYAYSDFCSDEQLDTGSTSSMERYFSENSLSDSDKDEVRNYVQNGSSDPAPGSNPNYYGKRKQAGESWGGGLGGGYEFNVNSTRDGAEGFGIYVWEISKGYREEDIVLSGVIPHSDIQRYEIRDFIDETFSNYMRTAAKHKRKADTSEDPAHLPDHFDDEGGSTDLDDAGRPTQPKDAALAAKWHRASAKGMSLADFAAFHDITASTAKRVARLPFDGGHQTVADAQDAYATSPIADDVTNLDEHAPVIEHFSQKTANPNFVDNVGAGAGDWDTWGEDQLFGPDSQYDSWVSNYYGGEHSVDALEDYISNSVGNFAPEGLDSIRRHWNDHFGSRTKTAGWNEYNWRTYGVGNASYAPDHPTGDVIADYVDALYPSENPSAVVVEDEGEMTVEVFDGFGGLVDTKVFYDITESMAWASKVLQKAYKGEARGDKGQGKFFTTPGVGKLFGSRVAGIRTASSPVPRAASGGIHRVAGWDWDQRQSAYIAQAGQDEFDCTCGQKVATPSFKTCECGTIWNSYHIETAAGRKTLCREVPSRDALLASLS